MAKLGGIIAGALGGGAGAAQGMAQGAIEDERKLDIAAQLSQMEEQRQLRIAEAGETRRRAGRGADIEQDIATSGRRAEAEAGRVGIVGKAETEVAGERAGIVGKAQAGAQREAEAEFGKDKAAQAGVRARAQAGHVEGSSERLRAMEAQMSIDDRKAHRRLVDELSVIQSNDKLSPEDKQKQIDAKQKQIELNAQRAGVKPVGDEDTTKKVKVKYTIDPLTGEKVGEEREESTEKRKRVPGAAPAKADASKAGKGPAVGTIRNGFRFLGGNPNDEKSWAPAGRSSTGKVQ